jgi:predicted NAD/FAD-binding protein
VEEDGRTVPVDTGFIVYNEATYPNLTALFRHLAIDTAESDMGFCVSLGGGRIEYAGRDLRSLVGPWRNLADAGHWRMLADMARFLLRGERDVANLDEHMPLWAYLEQRRYSRAFIERHLLPMAAAIWSSPPGQMRQYPAKAFLRFFGNHGLLSYNNRPRWRTVKGGSRRYVQRLMEDGGFRVRAATPVTRVERHATGVTLASAAGPLGLYDHVVIASHADQALAMLADPSAGEHALLSQFSYAGNKVVLHRDASFMPRSRNLWSSWNYLAAANGDSHGVTYWMNALQPLDTSTDYFVSLNAAAEPDESKVVQRMSYRHPVYDARNMLAQRDLWALQGRQRTWFCAAYFGAGFHEDGLQAGLAVAEQLGGLRRPWQIAEAASRITVGAPPPLLSPPLREAAE